MNKKLEEAGIKAQTMGAQSYEPMMKQSIALDEFATGKAAMWECGPWAVETILSKNPEMDLGMFPIPGTKGQEPGWLVGGPGSAFAINANSEHIEEALQIMEAYYDEQEKGKDLFINDSSSIYRIPVLQDLKILLSFSRIIKRLRQLNIQ